MKKEDIPVLDQLIQTLEDAVLNLEEAFEKKDHEEFNKSKKFIIELQKKIAEVIK